MAIAPKKKSNDLTDLPVIRINKQLDLWIENVFHNANKKVKVNKVDFLRECLMRGLSSVERSLTEKNLKVGYFKANTVDGIYFCGDFLNNNEEIMPLEKFVAALKTLEDRQEITTVINPRQEEIYFQLVKEYGISHDQYFAKQDGEKVEYYVFVKDSETPFLRCFSESGYIAQQQAMAIYIDKNPEAAKRDMKELAKDFKVKNKFAMMGEKNGIK
jgi:hypothetical protein